MLTIPVKPMTVDEFLLLPETETASEYINNKIIQKPMPKGKHSFLPYIQQGKSKIKYLNKEVKEQTNVTRKSDRCTRFRPFRHNSGNSR